MYETQTTDKIMASQLATLLDHLEPAPTVLSLDCFDTLLWRKAATPADVFYTLQNHPEFIAAGLTAPLRMSAEARARQCKLFHQQGSEVTLVDIYRAHRATLTDTTIAALAQAELETEIATCYAFPATVALIREAARRGIAVIIVSDTYFTVTQLQTLLASALPADVLAAIQHVFCSSAYQQSKSQGLFTKVLHTLKQPAANLFHLGDNLTADYIAPRQLNIRALHVVRDTASMADLYRLQTITAAIIDPAIRSQRALHNPFHGILAADAAAPKPETQLGYASLGPLLYAFATYLQKEVAELEQQGKTPKVLFLMRDAYLPSLACEVLAGQPMGYPVRISRFASFAASFRTVHDIDRYLLTVMPSQRFQDIVRQLGLPAKVAEPLIKTAERHAEPVAEFTRLIHRNDIVNIIFTKSTEYRQRLLRYLEKTIQLTPGDTLLCVDLGYSGTTQQLLTPVFQDMNVTLEGRYLISLRTSDPNSERRGMIEASWCDDNVMRMLVSHIALLEQLCTANEKSVVNYDAVGNPVFSDIAMQTEQQESLTRIQAECLRFIPDAKAFFSQHTTAWPLLREAVMIELARMIFLPTAAEMQYLQRFQFDVNMGTADIHRLFDIEQGLTGLRRRGLFYMEKNAKSKRTNYPIELRAAGFELALTAMVQNRLGLEITPGDLLSRQRTLEARLHDGRTTDTVQLDATATHDGYYAVWAPLGAAVSFSLGKAYQWFQLDSADLITVDAFIQQKEAEQQIDALPLLHYENITVHRGGLMECTSSSGAIVMQRNGELPGDEYILRLVFRPLVEQEVPAVTVQQGMRVGFTIST